MKNLSVYISILLIFSLIIYPAINVSGTYRKFKVTVSIQSLGGIINDAYGDIVEINYILPEGAEPHLYQVTPDIIKSLSDTDIFVFTGHFSFEYTILDSFRDKPALYLDLETGYFGKYKLKLLEFPGNVSRGYNPHGYWLLPDNALKIAEAFKDLLINLDPTNSDLYNQYYLRFSQEIAEIKEIYGKLSGEYGLADSYILLGFPAEQYIIYPLNVTIVNVLVRGPGQMITPNELSDAIAMLSKVYNKYIIVSDIGLSMAVGDILSNISNEVGSKIIYIDVVGASFESYKSLVYYNLGRISGGILAEAPNMGSESGGELNYLSILFILLLLVIVIIEAIYIYLISKVY